MRCVFTSNENVTPEIAVSWGEREIVPCQRSPCLWQPLPLRQLLSGLLCSQLHQHLRLRLRPLRSELNLLPLTTASALASVPNFPCSASWADNERACRAGLLPRAAGSVACPTSREVREIRWFGLLHQEFCNAQPTNSLAQAGPCCVPISDCDFSTRFPNGFGRPV